jgi:hypothetical protein
MRDSGLRIHGFASCRYQTRQSSWVANLCREAVGVEPRQGRRFGIEPSWSATNQPPDARRTTQPIADGTSQREALPVA